MKGLSCSVSDTVVESSVDSTWKFYDNPFFVAVVASVVVEATLNPHPKVEQRKKQVQSSTPRTVSRQQSPRTTKSPKSPLEVKTSRSSSVEESTQKQHEVEVYLDQKLRVEQQSPSKVKGVKPTGPEENNQRSRLERKSPHEVKRPKPTNSEETNQKLRMELLKAWTTIEKLQKAHDSAKLKAERLKARLHDGKASWESQVEEKITSSLQTMKTKLAEEKNACRILAGENERFETELLQIRKAISDAKKDAVLERNAKKMVEDVCDELAKEVGQDRALVLELRKQSAGARREAEDTRKALQMGEVWKEEKVQGKLAEARFEVLEKSSELDQTVVTVEEFLCEKEKRFSKYREEYKTEVRSGEDHIYHRPGSLSSLRLLEGRVHKEQMKLVLNGTRARKGYVENGMVKNGRKSMVPKIWPTSIKIKANSD